MNEKREAGIIREVLLGDPQPFGFLVQEYQGPIYNLMLRMTGNEDLAADLAQEAFIRAYEKLDTFKQGKRFFPWLYSVALNMSRSWFRKNGGRYDVPYEGSVAEVDNFEGTDVQKSMGDHLDAKAAFEHVKDLAPKYREALMLRYRYEFTIKEIAETLDVSLSAVKMRLSRGLEMVRGKMIEEKDD